MHNADWDGIKAVPIAIMVSGLILITINYTPMGVIVFGAIALIWLYRYLRNKIYIYNWDRYCTLMRFERQENTPPPKLGKGALSPEYQDTLHRAKAREYLDDTD